MSDAKSLGQAFITEETRIGRLATVGADGDPHVVPIWFKVDGDRLLVHTMAASRKAQNIDVTGRFSLTVDRDAMPYRGVTMVGRAEVVPNVVVDSLALVRELALSYLGPTEGPAYGDYVAAIAGDHVTLVLRPETWEYWDHAG